VLREAIALARAAGAADRRPDALGRSGV
jgi:hypothetical protein